MENRKPEISTLIDLSDRAMKKKDENQKDIEGPFENNNIRIPDIMNRIAALEDKLSDTSTVADLSKLSEKAKGRRIVDVDNTTNSQKTPALAVENKITALEQLISEASTLINLLDTVVKQKDNYISDIEGSIKNKESLISSLTGTLNQKDLDISQLRDSLKKQDEQISIIDKAVQDKTRHIDDLEITAQQRESLISLLQNSLAQKDSAISSLRQTENKNNDHIYTLEYSVRQKDACIESLCAMADKKDKRIFSLTNTDRQRDTKVSDLENILQNKSDEISLLKDALHKKDQRLSYLEHSLNEKDSQMSAFKNRVNSKEEYPANLEHKLDSQQSSLSLIHDSQGWKWLMLYYRLRDRLLPINTWRRSLYKFSFEAMQNPRVLMQRGVFSHIKSHKNELYYTCDYPLRLEKNFSKYLSVSGWALSPNGIDRVEIYCDNQFLMNASYGRLRPDVQKSYPQIKDSDQSGFYCLLNGLESGPHELTLKIIAKDGKTGIIIRSINITESAKDIKVPRVPLMALNENHIEPLDDSFVSVIIPTLNAGSDFINMLLSHKNQKGIQKLEIVVVDSGSSDETCAIASDYGATLIQIPQEKFSHSYSRNLGAKHAAGRYLLFMTQDALPPSEYWIFEMLTVVQQNGVVAASCADYPREDTDLYYRVASWYHRRFLEIDGCDRIVSKPEVEDHMTLRKNAQLSDTACLIVKDVFTKYKSNKNYGEDLDLGIRLIRSGYKLALLGSTGVIHSHNWSTHQHMKRGYVDNIFLPDILPDYPMNSVDFDALRSDIIATYHTINSLFGEDYTLDKSLLKIEEFIDSINRKFDAACRTNNRPPGMIMKNRYIDDQFTSFLNTMISSNSIESDYNLSAGVMLNAVRAFANATLEYIRHTYDVIDDYLLEDFKSCIYKAFANQAGVHLAFSYLQSSNSRKKELSTLNKELMAGI